MSVWVSPRRLVRVCPAIPERPGSRQLMVMRALRDERIAPGYCPEVSLSSMLIFNVVLSPMMVFPTEMSTLQIRLM